MEHVDASQRPYLLEGVELQLTLFNDEPLALSLSKEVELTVESVGPELGAGSGAVVKNAVLSNGVNLKVPGFCGEGEAIVVNTETHEYVRRA